MTSFKKMYLVPHDNVMSGNGLPGITKKESDIEKLNLIDNKMVKLLADDTLSAEVKLPIYNQLVNIFSELLTEIRKAEKLPEEPSKKKPYQDFEQINTDNVMKTLHRNLHTRGETVINTLQPYITVNSESQVIDSNGVPIENSDIDEIVRAISYKNTPKTLPEGFLYVMETLRKRNPELYQNLFSNTTESPNRKRTVSKNSPTKKVVSVNSSPEQTPKTFNNRKKRHNTIPTDHIPVFSVENYDLTEKDEIHV